MTRILSVDPKPTLIPNMMRSKVRYSNTVALQPLGTIRPTYLRFLQRMISGVFGMKSVVLAPSTLPRHMWYEDRNQYSADLALDFLFEKMGDNHRIIGVLDKDMFATGRSFVFGYAHLRDGVGIISLHRLMEDYYHRPHNSKLLHKRIYNTLVHELGHTFGAPHCENDCLMHSCTHVESLTDLAPFFCNTCMHKIRDNQAVRPESAEGLFRKAGAYMRRRHYTDKAKMLYQKAFDINPDPKYLNDLGVAQLALNEREAAQASFKRAAELDGALPHPFYNLGILLGKEDKEKADKYFEDGLARDPDPINAEKYVGKLYEQLFNDREKAMKHYQRYVDLGGTDRGIALELAAYAR